MFVSVKEAVELTGKSQTTIYRLCKKRSHTRYVKKKDNKYFIDKEYLLATYPAINENDMENNKIEKTTHSQQNDLIEFTINDTNKETDEELGEKMIDDISGKITERFKKAENEVLELQNQEQTKSVTLSWETIIGVSAGLLIIAGFIFMLYYTTK